MSLKERFEKKLIVTPGCWIWAGLKTQKGYGRIRIGKRMVLAHRTSFELYAGEIEEGMLVLHKCDNPSCVNPDHLFTGTHADNANDKVQKGRLKKSIGRNNGAAKLTEEQAREIYVDTRIYREIAAQYGVATSQVQRIKAGRYWAHLFEAKA